MIITISIDASPDLIHSLAIHCSNEQKKAKRKEKSKKLKKSLDKSARLA